MKWLKKHLFATTVAVLLVGALAPWVALHAQDIQEWPADMILRPLNPRVIIDGMLRILPKYSTKVPTCTDSVTGGANCIVTGSDTFMAGLIKAGFPTVGGNPNNVVVTFSATQASPPACVAQYGNTYGYYIYAVTTTTTTATIKLGRPASVLTPATAEWTGGDTFSLICGGVS